MSGTAMVNLLLRLSPLRPCVLLEVVRRRDFTDERLRELHALSSALMAEDFDHFRVHARTNHVVHVFRRADTGAIVGFQFWKTAPLALPRSLAIVGGKLRIAPELRARGLHLVSGLVFLLDTKRRAPRARLYRISIASLFGFVSITEALAGYQIFDPGRRGGEEDEAVRAAFLSLAGESDFRVDEQTGLFFVGIFMTEDTLRRYPPRYFDRPAAKRYAAVNPDFRTNGCYAGFWFRFTRDNLLAMTRAIATKLLRPAAAR